MKKLFAILLSLCLFLSGCSSPQQPQIDTENIFKLTRSEYDTSLNTVYNSSTNIGFNLPEGWFAEDAYDFLQNYGYDEFTVTELEGYDYKDFITLPEIPDFGVRSSDGLQIAKVYFLNKLFYDSLSAPVYADAVVETAKEDGDTLCQVLETRTVGDHSFTSFIVGLGDDYFAKYFACDISDEYLMVILHVGLLTDENVIDILSYLY